MKTKKIIKSSASKYQVVHKQKFKDISSTGQVNVERRVLDLESGAMMSLEFFLFFLFSHSKDENANIGISVPM